MLGFIFVKNVGTQFKKTKSEFNLKNLVNMLFITFRGFIPYIVAVSHTVL